MGLMSAAGAVFARGLARLLTARAAHYTALLPPARAERMACERRR